MAKQITGTVTFTFEAEVSDEDAASIDAEGYIFDYNWDRRGFRLQFTEDSAEVYAHLDSFGVDGGYIIEQVEDIPDDDEEDEPVQGLELVDHDGLELVAE